MDIIYQVPRVIIRAYLAFLKDLECIYDCCRLPNRHWSIYSTERNKILI